MNTPRRLTDCRKFGFHPLHGDSFEAAGWQVAGLGHSSPTPFNTPGEYSEAEIASRLAPFAALEKLVLICHCPPLDTALDEASSGKHFGSKVCASSSKQTSRSGSSVGTFTRQPGGGPSWVERVA